MNTLIYGNWRTGSNLLLGIFFDMGFFDFREYYTLTGIMNNPTQDRINDTNRYLSSLLDQTRTNSVIKIAFSQRLAVTDKVLNRFDTKIVLYRRNILQSAISRIVAIERKSFINDRDVAQPHLSKRIEIVEISRTLNKILFENNTFIAECMPEEISHVVNYETDLVPYFQHNPTLYRPSDNYTIVNRDELTEWYNQSDYAKHFDLINSYYDNLKSKVNTTDFSDYIDSIKQKVN